MTQKKPPVGSKAMQVNTTDFVEVLKQAGIVAASAVLAYLTTWIAAEDFGMWTGVITAGFTTLAATFRRWIADNSKVPQ